MKNREKLENKILVAIAILVLFIVLILKMEAKKELKATEEYTIQSGETLWSIGTEYKPKDMHIQEYIYELQKYNNIGSEIYAGQKIQILKFE